MLSSINWLRQLIARDKAKQPQLKNQLTKSHESSQPTIGRDSLTVASFPAYLWLTNQAYCRLFVSLTVCGFLDCLFVAYY